MEKIIVLGSCVSRVPLLDGDTTAHGVADDNMDLMYYLDKQNIVCAMMPAPFKREQVATITDTKMNEKYALRSLQQNLNKDTLPMLLDAKADWIITDFMDMHMAHAKYNGTVFATQAYEFYRTELGENLFDVDKVRFLEKPFEEWKEYVDEFWDQMVAKYDNDHIILNRFRCNAWYMNKEGTVDQIPERFHALSHPLPELNEAAKRLEDYIIEKYNPWVIDLTKYFMGDENKWDNLQGAHFEMKYYREVFDGVKDIIYGRANQRCISNPHFFASERRGIEEDLQLPFDVEEGIKTMETFYKKGNLLWINVLDKLYIRNVKDDRVEGYIQKLREDYEESYHLWNL